jgi:DivIVA domain-containing protein
MAMAVIAVVAGVVTGRIGGGMEAPESSLPFRGLPPDGVIPEDLEALRFTPALRGYRMHQVDEVLDQLTRELRDRDDEIARLRAALRAGEAAEGADDPGDERRRAFAPPGSPSESPQGLF